MQKFLVLSLAAITLIGFTSCKTAERYQRNNEAGEQWLAQHTASPRLNIAGNWQADDWGSATFYQSGRQITGTLGGFQVEGVVSGPRAYLLISEGGWIYYTMILGSPGSGRLSGYFSYSVPFSTADQRVVLMRRF